MSGPATTYAELVREIQALIEHHVEADPTACAYMIAKIAGNTIRARHGAANARDLFQKIVDEYALEAPTA